MSRKDITRVWLLESNQDRLFDEFATVKEQSSFAQSPTSSKKVLLFEEKNPTPLSGDATYPVGIVFEHIYANAAEKEDGVERTRIFSVPLLGHGLLQQLEGRLLDYIDATYAEREQREAQKRIVRRILWEFRNKASEQNQQKFKDAPVKE